MFSDKLTFRQHCIMLPKLAECHSLLQQVWEGGRLVVVVILFCKKIIMAVEGGLKMNFNLPLRTTKYSFGYKAMSSLIGFPPVLSLNFSTAFFIGIVEQEMVLIVI